MFCMGVQITVRDVDPQVYREFKAEVVRRGFTLGSALNLAMLKFKAELRKKRPSFMSLHKPFHGGKGTEHVSEEIDSILYGE